MTLRYRDKSGGITNRSLKAAKNNLQKIGRISNIKGYRFRSTRNNINTTHEAVLVTGEKGTARFEGFLWGYAGEGPRGLVQLLKACGFTNGAAYTIAFCCERKEDVGVDWEINFPVSIYTNPKEIVV